ncbi:hypothetical protein KC19_2G249800 [Ceratodon purpureus]|uniref:Uncharacterized protein n=1 Tax=Ceratodon purpureus TaxID=3225 RepID=A0A8T0J1G6_CERPU|nr:hypothetical protein KC19_2G249800 [Ceratodon purpureus]
MGSELEAKAIDPVDNGLYVLEDRLQGRVLENASTCFVKASAVAAVEKEWLNLCQLDYIWMAFYTPFICTFTLTDQVHRFGSAAGVVQHLKDSLAEALVLFYPLAGRLLMKDGPPRIHCNNAGAVFTEASVDMDMAELKTDDFLPLPMLSGLVAAGFGQYPTLPQMPDGLPTLIIQVTHFKCGGITLAANWSHGVADGKSGLHFMKSWSEIARGAQVSLLPSHQRDLLKPRDPPIPGSLVEPSAVSPDAQAISSKMKAEKKDQESKASTENSPEAKPEGESQTEEKKPQIASRTTEFTKEEITAIRKTATDHSNPETHLTRADCLSAHIWRTMTQARNRPNDARVRLWILIEGRKKLNFPPGYFGNVVAMTPVITTVNELLNCHVGDAAALIHTGIASITGEWFQGFVDFVHASGGKDMFAPEPLGPGSETGVSYLVRFPYYELDFGFGIPAFATRNTMGAWDGLVFVLPSSRGADHMVVMPNLQPEELSNFIAMAHDIPETKS